MVRVSRDKVTACLWVYTEINDPWDGKRSTFPALTENDKRRYLSEINFGVDQTNTKQFLEIFEYCTRLEPTNVTMELNDVPAKSPRWLDDKSEYFSWPRISFKELSIIRDTRSFVVLDRNSLTAELHVTREKCFEFFSRVYICNTIYATGWDNIITIELDKTSTLHDFVVWGVVDGEPIHY